MIDRLARGEKKGTLPSRAYDYAELINRDKASLLRLFRLAGVI